MYRQGDVLVEKIKVLPTDIKKQKVGKKIILAYGEATGHHHFIETTEHTKSFVDTDGNLYLSLKEDTTLHHQEHDTIPIPNGFYKVTIQREYSPEEIRNVLD